MVLPAPFLPTTASFPLMRSLKSTFFSTISSLPGYRKLTFSKASSYSPSSRFSTGMLPDAWGFSMSRKARKSVMVVQIF